MINLKMCSLENNLNWEHNKSLKHTNVMIPYKRDFVALNKSVINYLTRCSYHLLYMHDGNQALEPLHDRHLKCQSK